MSDERSVEKLDSFTRELFQELFAAAGEKSAAAPQEIAEVADLLQKAREQDLTQPIVNLFRRLRRLRKEKGQTPRDLGMEESDLLQLAVKHQQIDEHEVTIGGRVLKALSIVEDANARAMAYLQEHPKAAPSGIELWDRIRENQERIKKALGMKQEDWDSFSGQLRFAIESVKTLSGILDLPENAVTDIQRVTSQYRMRLTPYYTSLIMPGAVNDPVLLQSVPTGK
jgi:hypothetical protein